MRGAKDENERATASPSASHTASRRYAAAALTALLGRWPHDFARCPPSAEWIDQQIDVALQIADRCLAKIQTGGKSCLPF